jgi:hypothetical protein
MVISQQQPYLMKYRELTSLRGRDEKSIVSDRWGKGQGNFGSILERTKMF